MSLAALLGATVYRQAVRAVAFHRLAAHGINLSEWRGPFGQGVEFLGTRWFAEPTELHLAAERRAEMDNRVTAAIERCSLLEWAFISSAEKRPSTPTKVSLKSSSEQNPKNPNIAAILNGMAALPRLKTLTLEDVDLDNDCWQALTAMPALSELSLSNCRLTDAQATLLSGLKHLTFLSISGEHHLTAASFPSLERLTWLRELSINIPGPDAEKLSHGMPSTQIWHNGTAMIEKATLDISRQKIEHLESKLETLKAAHAGP